MRARIFFLLFALSCAQIAFAGEPTLGEGDFVPIVPIPMPGGGSQTITSGGSLGAYINAIFTLSISVGAALAAIYIAIGGFEYIFSEAMANKQEGRTRIVHALYGLMILLLVTITLYIIGGADFIDLQLFNERPSGAP